MPGRRRGAPGAPSAGRTIWASVALSGLGLSLYLLVAAMARGAPAAAQEHAGQILAVERALGLAWELPAMEWGNGHPLVASGLAAFYTWAYWPIVLGAPCWCWRRNRRCFRLLRDAMLLSGLAGLVIFAAYPVAPPRLLPDLPSAATGAGVNAAPAHPGLFENPYAALPSFHVGWCALALATVALASRRHLVTVAGAALSGLMIAAVLVTANHYLIDVVAGLALCGAAALQARRWERWRAAQPRAVGDRGRQPARGQPGEQEPEPEQKPEDSPATSPPSHRRAA